MTTSSTNDRSAQTTDDPIVRRWLVDAEEHRGFAELANSETARLDHIAAAARLKKMAHERIQRLMEAKAERGMGSLDDGDLS